MKKVLHLFFCLLILVPATAIGGDFNYTRYESLLKRHVRTGMKIDGITVNAIGYPVTILFSAHVGLFQIALIWGLGGNGV